MDSREQRPHCLWLGSVHEPSGHADELRGFLRAQEHAGHAPALRAFTWAKQSVDLTPADAEMLRRQQHRRPQAPVVAIHHYLPSERQLDVPGAVNVARAMFETDRMPERWLAPLLARDELWVPCRHNVETFAASGIPRHKLRVVGETLDFDLFRPGAPPHPAVGRSDEYTFLTNFDFSARKGWEILLRAWGRAFGPDDGVRLVLKVGSFYATSAAVRERLTAFVARELGRATAPIELVTDMLGAQEMPGLYAAADAYVLASRGEGWGRPYMEAMAMGLPTIASDWGGNLEFMDPDTSWLVGGRLVPVPEDAELFNDLYAGHRWFEPDVDALAEALRGVAADPAAARARAAAARSRLLERFGPDALAARIDELARAAADRYGSPSAGVLLRGRFGSQESLSVVNEGLAGALHDAGVTVRHAPPGAGPRDGALPTITHSWPPEFEAGTDGPTIAVLPWEYGAPPAAWVDAARRRLDRVWVPSEFVRAGYVEAGMPPGIVEVVPNGVDLERFDPQGPRLPLPGAAATTFLFVGGAIWRKGIDTLLAAWADAFGPDDDVQLVVRAFGAASWYRGQSATAELERFAGRTDVAPVHVLTEDLPATELPALYRSADVLVAPYRAEGFCLPALEAMACGVPVVHPAGGPTCEFVPADAGWVVPAARVPLEDAGALPELAGEGHVLDVDLTGLVAALRDAARAGADARRRRSAAARAAAERLPWAAAAEAARASLEALARDALPPAALVEPARADGHPLSVVLGCRLAEHAGAAAAVRAWARAFGPEDPVTLAIAAGGDPGALAAELLDVLQAAGIDEDDLPDFALVSGDADHALSTLVAGADAVLVPDGMAATGVLRRAVRLLPATPSALAAFRAGLPVPAST